MFLVKASWSMHGCQNGTTSASFFNHYHYYSLLFLLLFLSLLLLLLTSLLFTLLFSFSIFSLVNFSRIVVFQVTICSA